MKITKLIHSCLVVETPGASALFDPGNFSWSSGLVKVNKLPKLDYLVITHNHADHLDEDFVEAVVERFPDIKLAANREVREQLAKLNLDSADDTCLEFDAPHEKLPMPGKPPANSGWHFGQFSHPGDSLHFDETRKVLALPYVAPWGSTTEAVELAAKLKPEYVIPIHDWHLNDQARQWYAGLLERALSGFGVEVLDIENGPVEL